MVYMCVSTIGTFGSTLLSTKPTKLLSPTLLIAFAFVYGLATVSRGNSDPRLILNAIRSGSVSGPLYRHRHTYILNKKRNTPAMVIRRKKGSELGTIARQMAQH